MPYFRRGKSERLFIRDKNSSLKEVSPKKKVFTSNLSRISRYRLLYQIYMINKFCHIVVDLLLLVAIANPNEINNFN